VVRIGGGECALDPANPRAVPAGTGALVAEMFGRRYSRSEKRYMSRRMPVLMSSQRRILGGTSSHFPSLPPGCVNFFEASVFPSDRSMLACYWGGSAGSRPMRSGGRLVSFHRRFISRCHRTVGFVQFLGVARDWR
jgi:hypothetical protein